MHGLAPDEARTLVSDRPLSDYFELAIKAHPTERSGKTIANWLLTELLGALNAESKEIGAVADASRDAVEARRPGRERHDQRQDRQGGLRRSIPHRR